MRWFRARSLQAALALRLGLLLLVVTLLAVVTLAWLAETTADTLSRQGLYRLAEELADAVDDDGEVDDLDQLRERGLLNPDTLFALREEEDRLLHASSAAVGELALSRPRPGRRNNSFRITDFGTPARDYDAIEVRERSERGTVYVLVAEPANEREALLNALLRDIGWQAAWVIPAFIALALLVGIYAIRSGLRPLREAVTQAAAIRPETLSRRLSEDSLPSEVRPLAAAVNRAFDRLEAGFELQRRFTANAAHELRTPLAIVTAALDTLPQSEKQQALRHDVARMNRLVEQLLHVARLDSVVLDASQVVDLRACAKRSVEYMAPVAIEKTRELAFDGGTQPVLVRGHAPAIEDALRNLIENALAHAPPHSEIQVRVYPQGKVSVLDGGAGIAPENRERIFERFWRGSGAADGGSGLGLAIVREIMSQHGGTVEVDAAPEGGCRFTLNFRTVGGAV
jgi:signal transduction histidine kinase